MHQAKIYRMKTSYFVLGDDCSEMTMATSELTGYFYGITSYKL